MTLLRRKSPPRLAARRWSLQEYNRLAELGFFEGQRVELIDGKIYQMPSQNHPHVAALENARHALASVFVGSHWVRVQAPLHIGNSAPEPDLAVVVGRPADYSNHPTGALLIVEVSDSTLLADRWKGNLYASTGTGDYWVINIVQRQLEVYRAPVADPAVKRFGHRYSTLATLAHDQTVSPLALPQAVLCVSDLLP